jgi:hypothetical protein
MQKILPTRLPLGSPALVLDLAIVTDSPMMMVTGYPHLLSNLIPVQIHHSIFQFNSFQFFNFLPVGHLQVVISMTDFSFLKMHIYLAPGGTLRKISNAELQEDVQPSNRLPECCSPPQYQIVDETQPKMWINDISSACLWRRWSHFSHCSHVSFGFLRPLSAILTSDIQVL